MTKQAEDDDWLEKTFESSIGTCPEISPQRTYEIAELISMAESVCGDREISTEKILEEMTSPFLTNFKENPKMETIFHEAAKRTGVTISIGEAKLGIKGYKGLYCSDKVNKDLGPFWDFVDKLREQQGV